MERGKAEYAMTMVVEGAGWSDGSGDTLRVAKTETKNDSPGEK